MVRVGGTLLTVLLVVVACGDSGGGAGSGTAFESGAEVAGVLGCEFVVDSAQEDFQIVQPPPRDAGTCVLDGRELTIALFDDESDLDQYLLASTVLAKGFGLTGEIGIVKAGPVTAYFEDESEVDLFESEGTFEVKISEDTRQRLETVADALGGDVVTFDL
jgi:hypothetical protein